MQKSKLKIKMRRGHKGRKKKAKKGKYGKEKATEGRGRERKGMKGEMGVKFGNAHFINEMLKEGEGQVLLISKCKETKTSSYVLLIYLLLK